MLHIVRKNETLEDIAKIYDTEAEKLRNSISWKTTDRYARIRAYGCQTANIPFF